MHICAHRHDVAIMRPPDVICEIALQIRKPQGSLGRHVLLSPNPSRQTQMPQNYEKTTHFRTKPKVVEILSENISLSSEKQLVRMMQKDRYGE